MSAHKSYTANEAVAFGLFVLVVLIVFGLIVQEWLHNRRELRELEGQRRYWLGPRTPKRRATDRDYRWFWISIVFVAMLAALWGTFQ